MAEKDSAEGGPAPSSGTLDTRAWLRPFVRPLWPIFREVLVMSLFINLLALAVPAFTVQVYDRVIFHAGLSTLQGLAIGMVFVILFDHLLRQGRSRIMQKAALRIDVGVGRKLFDKVLAVPLSELESKPNAHWQALFRDVEMVRNTLSGPSALLLADLPFALIFIALIVFIAAPIVWVLAIILPLYIVLAWRSATVLHSFSADERKVSYGRDALVQETIAGRATVKALALDESIRPMWEERHADTIVQALDRGRRADQYVNLGAVITIYEPGRADRRRRTRHHRPANVDRRADRRQHAGGPGAWAVQPARRIVAELRTVQAGRVAPRRDIPHPGGASGGRHHDGAPAW